MCPEVLNNFNAQGVANTIWACAKSGFVHLKLMNALAERAMLLVGLFGPHRDLSGWTMTGKPMIPKMLLIPRMMPKMVRRAMIFQRLMLSKKTAPHPSFRLP
jgi:hypothetical protein